MSEINVIELKSKTGTKVLIRSASTNDAIKILKLAESVIGEEIYQLTSSSEFKMTAEAEEKWVESHRINPNKIILVAEIASEIVGILDFSNGHRNRIAHTGEFGMSVSKEYRNQGIGELLLNTLIEWATKNSTIEKIGLNVHANNERAIGLYKKMGFEIEGTRRRDLKYSENSYVDTVVMARFL